MSEVAELKNMIDEAAAKCHEASQKARDVGHAQAETETAETADKLEQLLRQVEAEYPE